MGTALAPASVATPKVSPQRTRPRWVRDFRRAMTQFARKSAIPLR